MTGRATTQAISATELNEGDSDAVRIRHQLDAWANASNRTPQIGGDTRGRRRRWIIRRGAVAGNEARPRRCGVPRPPRAPRPKQPRQPGPRQERPRQTEANDSRHGRWRAGGAQRAARAADGIPQHPPCRSPLPPRRNAHAPAAPLPLLQHSRWRRSLPIFQSRAWPRYFPAIRLRSWCSPPRWKPASW